MSWPEFVIAVTLTVLGIRSVAYWASRPFDSDDPVDHALYAIYVAGRSGLWFAFAGLFAVIAFSDTSGVPLIDELNGFRWYVLVFATLGVMQFLARWFLGQRGDGDPPPPGQ
jgi:hypothetical protein